MKKWGLRAVAWSMLLAMLISSAGMPVKAHAAEVLGSGLGGSLETLTGENALVLTGEEADKDGNIAVTGGNWDRVIIRRSEKVEKIILQGVTADELVIEGGMNCNIQVNASSIKKIVVEEPQTEGINYTELAKALESGENKGAAWIQYAKYTSTLIQLKNKVPKLTLSGNTKTEVVVIKTNATVNTKKAEVDKVYIEALDESIPLSIGVKNYDGAIEMKAEATDGSSAMAKVLLDLRGSEPENVHIHAKNAYCAMQGEDAVIGDMEIAGSIYVRSMVDVKEVHLEESAADTTMKLYGDVEEMTVAGEGNKVVLTSSANVGHMAVEGNETKIYGWGNLESADVTGENVQLAVPGADVTGECDKTIPDEMYEMNNGASSTPSKPVVVPTVAPTVTPVATPTVTPTTTPTIAPTAAPEPTLAPEEPKEPCEEHKKIKLTAELKEGSTNCEDGVIIKSVCEDCGTVLYEGGTKRHYMVEKARVDLDEYAEGCGACFVIEKCLCGACDMQCRYGFDYMALAEWTVDEEYDEDGSLVITGTHRTKDIRFEGVEVWKQAEGCKYEFSQDYKIYVGDELVNNLVERGMSIRHNEASRAELLEGSESCEDGVRVVSYCTECKAEFNEEIYNEHKGALTDVFSLAEFDDLCVGVFKKYSCACGKEQWTSINSYCEYGAPECSEYEDTEGHLHTVTTYTCKNCPFKLVEDYMETANDDCTVDYRDTLKLYVNDELVKEMFADNYYINHTWDYVSIELSEGATSCEDGYFYEAVCKECGETESGEGHGHIKTLERMEFDASEYGVAMLCEGYYEIDYCACGEGTSINNAFECTFTEYDTSYRDEEGNWHEQIGYSCQRCELQYVEDTMVVSNPDGTKTKTVEYWFTVGGMPAKELVIEMRVSGDTPLPTPKPVLYDFRDGSIVPTDTDGKFSIFYGPLFIGKSDSATYQYNGTQHGVAFKNGNTIEIFVTGPARIEIADCSYSGMKELTLTNKTGTWTQTKASGISCTEEITFEYIGEETTLILELTDQVYIPYIRVTPFIYDGELPEEPVVTEYDFGDGSIIPTDTNGKSDVNSGDLTVKVGPSNAYSYNDEQHGVYFKNGNSIEIEVDGSVVVEVGDCSYSAATSLTMTNADGTWTQTKDCKQGCYHNGSVVTFEYTGEATTLILAFTDAAYVPHIKVTTVVEE
ncbi:MAG: hypothetical protein E7260_05055 [Lachnospiraceae bacterium]|nr:hypothetical protein [Lachnospiraceae bacterium]